MVNDAELVQKAKRGDDSALSELLYRYQDRIFTYLLKMLRHHHDAEEATQETFVNVVRNIRHYKEQGYFKSWIYKVAYHEGLRCLRKRCPSDDQDILTEPADKGPSPDQQLFSAERLKEINAALNQLPEKEKQVILLRVYSDFTFKEIAELMDTPLSTALGRMRNGTMRLKNFLSTR